MAATFDPHHGGRVLLGLERPSPRLPRATLSGVRPLTGSIVVHAAALALLLLADASLHTAFPARDTPRPTAHLTWVTTRPTLVPGAAPRGGGGGGDRRPASPAAGRTRESPLPSRTIERVIPVAAAPLLPLVADIPVHGTDATSAPPAVGVDGAGEGRGEGTGGGMGLGQGTGVGSGIGSGIGPGSGGGTGGGVYRPGAGVTTPIVVKQVRPSYPDDAVSRRTQGSVALEVIVRRTGIPEVVRVLRPVDRGPLDHEAERSVREWRFLPGRLNGTPVDVLVTIVVDFVLY